MTLRVWLSPTTSECFTGGRTEETSASVSGLYYQGLEVHRSNPDGGEYIEIPGDPHTPTFPKQPVPAKHILRVTYEGSYITGFRTDGIYEIGKARASLRMNRTTIGPRQEISISAPKISQLQAIYTLVRQGKLKPSQAWTECPAIASEM